MPSNIITTLLCVLLMLRPFISGRMQYRLDILYTLALLCVTCILIAKRPDIVRKHRASLPLAIFWTALLLSVIFSANFEKSFCRIYAYVAYFMVFFAVAGLSVREKRAVLWALLISSILVSYDALGWLLYGFFPVMDYLRAHSVRGFAMEYLSRGRAFVPFVTPSALGGYLILFFPAAVAHLAYLETRSKTGAPSKIDIRRVVAVAAITLLAMALLASQSLGAIFSLAAAFGLTAFFSGKRQCLGWKTLCLSGVLLVAGVAVLFALRELGGRTVNQPTLSFVNRLSYWRHAIFLIVQHPLTGFGLDNYPFYLSKSPHNSYLQIWVETGSLGLAGFAVFLYQTLRSGWEKLANDKEMLQLGLFVGYVAFLIHNMVDYTFFLPEVALSWWALAALL